MNASIRQAALASTAACLISWSAQAAGETPHEKFAALAASYFRGDFAAHPIAATQTGVHAGDGRVDAVSATDHAAQLARLIATQHRLAAIDGAALPPADRDDLRILIGAVDAARLQEETIQPWRHNPDHYVQLATYALYTLIARDFAPARDRMAAAIARLNALPSRLVDAQANLVAVPPVFLDIAQENLGGAIGFFARDVPAAFAGVADPSLQAALRKADAGAVASLRRYGDFLAALKPHAAGSFVLGRDILQRSLADDLVDVPVERVLAAGRAQLARDQAALKAVAARLSPGGPAGALARIGGDHPEAAKLVPTARDQLATLQRFVAEHHIVDLPSQTLPVVAETPPFSRAMIFGEMEAPGALETGAITAYYYITPVNAAETPADQSRYLAYFNRSMLSNLSVHETMPGHFVQFLFLRAHPEWSLVRKLLNSYSTTEGWAHYSEQMMLEEGLGGGSPELRVAQLQDALLRDCRLVASISMHTGAMTLAQAATLMRDQCFQPPSVAYKEARRGTADPGYYSYTLGKLEILKLRDDVRAREGKAFSLGRFHDRFLAAGLVPVSVIRREMTGADGPAL